VLKAIVESACELCESYEAVLRLTDGDALRFSAHQGPLTPRHEDLPINRGWTSGRAVIDRVAVHVEDMFSAAGDDFPEAQIRAREQGQRTVLSVPLLRESESVGAITLRRTEVNPFSDKQIALLQTFADQAVIAIGNVRLFEEVQQRTRELSESLKFQTASSEVLKVISRSPDALQPVLDAIARTSHELCGSDAATIFLFREDKAYFTAVSGDVPRHVEFLRANPAWIHEPNTLFERLLREKRTLHLPNVMDDPDLLGHERTALGGPRALLAAPLLLDGDAVGAIVLRQSHFKPFTPRQVQAIEVFADQAVIAIGNVRLFEEVQAKTRDLTEALTYQTGSGNILSVIASSPTDVGPTLEAIVRSACELCAAYDAVLVLRDDDALQLSAHHGPIPMNQTRWANDRTSISGRAIGDRLPVHLHDVLSDEGAEFPAGQEMSRRDGCHTILGVPMLREGESIGAIVLRRTEVHPFADKQIALLQTFADQAVIAIGNVRLFEEVQARTKELAASLDHLRTAQDRLVQTEKLASLGQLTAGIAHEIKNPLNFVNNFAALSAELADELNDVLKQATVTEKIGEEVDELTALLKDNLQKIVQHGRRADSIVKNMLLHSREGSGEHRPTDINALVDESLNLAYHGARAEKPQFNVTLRRNFDPSAGMIQAFPQEITRVFLNLISNGFYAVTRRKAEQDAAAFEPLVTATTRDLGDSVEIRISDNGTGIPPEVKDKMFNPFFTTKPAGEGTGLGLSMSHDIIVKQHGGTIEVDTEPGQFTEFRIVLPRKGNPPNKSRG
jgi:signal transduction histidine kinase